MKQLFALFFGIFIAVVVVLATDLDEWNSYKLKYKKNYQNQTENKIRMKIFLKNKQKIDDHNKKHVQGSVSYKMGLNKFSDQSPEELNALMKGLSPPDLLGSTHTGNETIDHLLARAKHHHHHQHHNHHRHHHHRHHNHHHRNNTIHEYLPDSIDWRHEGAVNGVANKIQGQCGSCWAFSTTGAIEGQYFRKTGKLVQLSEQNLVDCTSDILGLCGCSGCSLNGAYLYALINGIDLTDQYPTPYSATQGDCHFKSSNAIKITDFKRIPTGNEPKLREAIATVGPISVEMNARHDSLFHYSSGVYYEPECDAQNLDHGVLAVGYGTTDKGEDYWIVKNWWSEEWGEAGYFRLARNRDNHCGIATAAVYPII